MDRDRDPRSQTLVGNGAAVPVPVDPFDDGARTGPAMRQTFHLKTEFSDVVFAAPSPVTVRNRQSPAGSLRRHGRRPIGGFGKGAVYTVTSRSAPATANALRAADAGRCRRTVLDLFAADADGPRTGSRALALRDHRRAPTTYDKIRSHRSVARREHVRVLARRAAARPTPTTSSTTSCSDRASVGASRSRAAWWSWRASVGIPARLATGFVPGCAMR